MTDNTTESAPSGTMSDDEIVDAVMVSTKLFQPDHRKVMRESIRLTHASNSAAMQEAVEVLEWYAEQTRLARLIHSGGDAGRHALQDDGGNRARTVLAKLTA